MRSFCSAETSVSGVKHTAIKNESTHQCAQDRSTGGGHTGLGGIPNSAGPGGQLGLESRHTWLFRLVSSPSRFSLCQLPPLLPASWHPDFRSR
jgi:hypothetical protein